MLRKAINFNAAVQPDYLALPYHTCNQSCDVLKLRHKWIHTLDCKVNGLHVLQ